MWWLSVGTSICLGDCGRTEGPWTGEPIAKRKEENKADKKRTMHMNWFPLSMKGMYVGK